MTNPSLSENLAAPEHAVAVVFYNRKTARYALNVLAGAVDAQPGLADVSLLFPKSLAQLKVILAHQSKQFNNLLVCWSFYSTELDAVQAELNDIKTSFKQAQITHLAGGVHVTARPRESLDMGFDFVAVGEGEEIIVDVVSALRQNQRIDAVRGIACYRDNEFFKNGKGNNVDLDLYPPFAAKYRRFGPMEITRGCIYACKFCQTPFVNKARFRHRSLENIAEHMHTFYDYGLRDLRFISPSSLSYGSQDETVNLEAVEQMLAGTRTILGKDRRIFFGSFPSEVRPEHLSDASLNILKKYVDNDNLVIGGQSGSLRLLQETHRGHDVESIIHAVKLSIKHGFQPNVDFLFGLPGETPEDARQTMDLAGILTDLGAKIHTHTFMPLPGTPFQDRDAGNIHQHTQEQLLRFESVGKAYGQWKSQIKVAKDMVKRQRKQ